MPSPLSGPWRRFQEAKADELDKHKFRGSGKTENGPEWEGIEGELWVKGTGWNTQRSTGDRNTRLVTGEVLVGSLQGCLAF